MLINDDVIEQFGDDKRLIRNVFSEMLPLAIISRVQKCGFLI